MNPGEGFSVIGFVHHGKELLYQFSVPFYYSIIRCNIHVLRTYHIVLVRSAAKLSNVETNLYLGGWSLGNTRWSNLDRLFFFFRINFFWFNFYFILPEKTTKNIPLKAYPYLFFIRKWTLKFCLDLTIPRKL